LRDLNGGTNSVTGLIYDCAPDDRARRSVMKHMRDPLAHPGHLINHGFTSMVSNLVRVLKVAGE
jgi:hypothetical protein